MLILGIESSCDETAAAVVRDGTEILSNIVASQQDLHKIYGGVVPEIACRAHIES
ncbi:MAG: tRNA (adenosine(37)-N6)-threonylcarbamoyltransferase complex transferase subunit TsaD, partial [Planctomycetota bacterium]|nr:tRNA (adenosine(37)-N6)-threonylcarbamoyltransferase complex transferase subunit TsaD [Planctomycetota bacterium]